MRSQPTPGVKSHPSFGTVMSGRTWSAETSYRYGFNGKEGDDEFSVDEGSCDFGARMYDSRLGRWWSVDPEYMDFSGLSTYNYAANNPNYYIDPGGEIIIGRLLIMANTSFGYSATIVDKSSEINRILSRFQTYHRGDQVARTDNNLPNEKSGDLSDVTLNFEDPKIGLGGPNGNPARAVTTLKYDIDVDNNGNDTITNISINIQLEANITDDGEKVVVLMHQVALMTEEYANLISKYKNKEISVNDFVLAANGMEAAANTELAIGEASVYEKVANEVDLIIGREYSDNDGANNVDPSGLPVNTMMPWDPAHAAQINQYDALGDHPFECGVSHVDLSTDPHYVTNRPPSIIPQGTVMGVLTNYRHNRNELYDTMRNPANR